MKTMQFLKIICFHLLVLPLILTAQDHQSIVAIDTVEITDDGYTRFSDIQLSHNWDGLQLTFDTITQKQFNDFKRLYNPRVDTSTNRIVPLGESPFQVTLGDTAYIFKCGSGYCHHYQGFYPTLDSYLIIASGNEAWVTFLIERTTGKGVDIGGMNLAISPDNDQMIIYETDGYTEESHLSLLDISDVRQLSDLNAKTSKTFYMENWAIDELVWIKDTTIALKVSQGSSQPRKPIKVKYVRAEMEEKNTGANKK